MPTIHTEVFVPSGPVQRNKVLQRAIAQVRDTLPPTLTLDATIASGQRRPDGHDEPGTDYSVRITYTERGTGGNASVLPVGTFGHDKVADDEDADIDGVEKALDALAPDDASDALKATGQSPQGA